MNFPVLYFWLSIFLKDISATTVDCYAPLLINPGVNGLVGNVYYYPWVDKNRDENHNLLYTKAYQEEDFTANSTIVTANSGHSLTEVATEIKNVISTNLTWVCVPPAAENEIWGKNKNLHTSDGKIPVISITNYALSLNGYVVPQTSGEYTFSLGYSDDLIMFFYWKR